MRHPDEIMRDFQVAVMGREDIDPHAVLNEILDDVLNSMVLAINKIVDEGSIDPEHRTEIIDTVRDYITNHYDNAEGD